MAVLPEENKVAGVCHDTKRYSMESLRPDIEPSISKAPVRQGKCQLDIATFSTGNTIHGSPKSEVDCIIRGLNKAGL